MEPGKCWAAHSDPTFWNIMPSESSPRASPRCPIVGTSVVTLVPNARPLGAWLALPSPSHWLIQTIRLGYVNRFERVPPGSISWPAGRDCCPTGEGCDTAYVEDAVLQTILLCTQERVAVTFFLDSSSAQTDSMLCIRVLFRLSLSTFIVFTKVVEAALVLMREHNIHILDDWLILAHLRL